jgi:dTDP-4-amino-4,6-dideoxygalactose transaminase
MHVKPIAMLDLAAEYPAIESRIRRAIDEVLAAQKFINGPQVGELECKLAGRIGVGDAIAVSNGTDAILLALMALGVGKGDEVITTPFTFFATAGCVHRVGAKAVFVDIEADTFNIDATKIEAAITARTKAIIPVHLFGQCADMEAIHAIAKRRNLKVVEDAAQAIGSTYHGKSAGALGTAGCFSFYPTKNLGGFGEGGAVTTSDAELAQRLRQMRNHGQTQQYLHALVGGNFRLDTMKAAILLAKLEMLDTYNARRRANAAAYDAALADLRPQVATPVVRPHNGAAYHQYSILCDRRDELQAFLADAKIGTGVYYPVPLHLQPCFSDWGYRAGALPNSEQAAKRILSLPVHPTLASEDVQRVAERIHAFYAGRA